MYSNNLQQIELRPMGRKLDLQLNLPHLFFTMGTKIVLIILEGKTPWTNKALKT